MKAAAPTPTAQSASSARRIFRSERRAFRSDAIAGGAEHALERAQKEQDVGQRRARSHQADSPDFSGQRPKASANLHSEFVEQLAAHRGLIDTVRYAHGM